MTVDRPLHVPAPRFAFDLEDARRGDGCHRGFLAPGSWLTPGIVARCTLDDVMHIVGREDPHVGGRGRRQRDNQQDPDPGETENLQNLSPSGEPGIPQPAQRLQTPKSVFGVSHGRLRH